MRGDLLATRDALDLLTRRPRMCDGTGNRTDHRKRHRHDKQWQPNTIPGPLHRDTVTLLPGRNDAFRRIERERPVFTSQAGTLPTVRQRASLTTGNTRLIHTQNTRIFMTLPSAKLCFDIGDPHHQHMILLWVPLGVT